MDKYEIHGEFNLRKLDIKSKRIINRLNGYLNNLNLNIKDILEEHIKIFENNN